MRTALVTGASRGIGFSIAKYLEHDVDNLILVAKHKNTLAKAVAKISGNNIIPLVADLENPQEITKLVKEIKQKFSSLDILVNNAGVYIGKYLAKTTDQDLNTMVNLNLKAYLILTRDLLPLLEKGKNPIVINISSCAAHAEFFGETVYSATKAGVTAFSNILRKEVNSKNIRVTAIQPYGVDTYEVKRPNILLNPDEIGKAVSYIVQVPPEVQIDLLELSHINQWRGTKPSWIKD